MFANAAMLLIPVLTGAGLVYWSLIAGVSPATATLLNSLSTGLVAGLLYAFDPMEKAGMQGAFATISWDRIVWYFVLNVGVAWAWVLAQGGANIALISFAEVAYPLFVLLFSFFLIGPVRFTEFHWVGAVLIILGVSLLVYGNARAH